MGTFNIEMHRATFIIYLGVAFAASLDLSKIPQKQGNKSNASRQICCDYCIFPFKINNREFQMCTNMYTDPDDYICATEVNSDGDLTEWEYCDPCCPGASVETTPQMIPNEANKEGHCHCGVMNPSDVYGKIVGGQNSYIG